MRHLVRPSRPLLHLATRARSRDPRRVSHPTQSPPLNPKHTNPRSDYLRFTPINANYETDESQLSQSTKILLEHKINGREGGVFFEFCDVASYAQPAKGGDCPPEKGDAVAEVLDWLLFDMPAGNYPFRYISETEEGTGQFCINGTAWDNQFNIDTVPTTLEVEHVEREHSEL